MRNVLVTMQNRKGNVILLFAVVGLTTQVEALTSKRVVLKLDKADVQPIEGKRNYIETSKDALNTDRFEDDGFVLDITSKSKSVMENVYFKIFQSHMDRLFKRYEDEMFLRQLNIAREFSIMNKNINNIVQNKENSDDNVSDNESSETVFKINNLDKETEVKNKRNVNDNHNYLNMKLFKNLGKYKNDYKELYNYQSYNDYSENNVRGSNDYLNREEDSFMTDEEIDSESQDEEGEESEEFFERINEDRKDKEFGVFDYLVPSKEYDENNINTNPDGKFKYDGNFIPDDYFDNSDYEA